jgi:uncharacterized protein
MSDTTQDILVKVRAMAPSPQGVGVFLTDGIKTIAIFVDQLVATAIQLSAEGFKLPRPLTHELMFNILKGLGVQLDKIVVNDLKDDVFYARLYLTQQNELGRQILEVDARPSDSIALALRQGCPIYVRLPVWQAAEDMGWVLEAMEREPPSSSEDQTPSLGDSTP